MSDGGGGVRIVEKGAARGQEAGDAEDPETNGQAGEGAGSGSSAERDASGKEYLSNVEWSSMKTSTGSVLSNARGYLKATLEKVYGAEDGDGGLDTEAANEQRLRVAWLSAVLFFIVCGYWSLRSLKDPVFASIVGVEYIPSAKIASLFVVLTLVFVYNKAVDAESMRKHQLFYIIGGGYAVLFSCIAMLLRHPTIGLPNPEPNPSRFLGWLSYLAIESSGSIVIQLFWAFVNASVDLSFAKKYFGLIVAGSQVGSILGPTIATQAETIGVANLYFLGALCMLCMVLIVYGYVARFGPCAADLESAETKAASKKAGVMEGFTLFWKYPYIQGLAAISALFMIEVTILDYLMKFMANQRFHDMYPAPEDHALATEAFAAFMGQFGQLANTVSLLFSLFGTSFVIRRLGLRTTLLLFPSLIIGVMVVVFTFPNLWVVFASLIVIKGLSYSLNNPCKELLYQPTSSAVKFKCKSWIDTFGARGSKALGSLVTTTFATSMAGLLTYGSVVSLAVGAFLIVVARFMGRQFDEYTDAGYKVGEADQVAAEAAAAQANMVELRDLQNETEDTSCGLEEEGQATTPVSSEKQPNGNSEAQQAAAAAAELLDIEAGDTAKK